MMVSVRDGSEALASLSKTLGSQSQAMKNLVRQYESDGFSKDNMVKSLNILHGVHANQGKVILCGIGKSYKIANKLVATLNSLSIESSLLHPAEALHGDLGVIRERDCVVMLTASGNTPELIQLLPHIPEEVPIVLLTCNKESKLSKSSQVKSLLYVELPHHLKEESIHGIPAPTVSAQLSLALADAAILALSELVEKDVNKRKKMFALKHPGGSIGASLSNFNEKYVVSEDPHTSMSSHVSSSSMLSLEQIRSTLHATGGSRVDSVSTSLTSSEDEATESSLKADFKLSAKIKYADESHILRFNISEFEAIDRPTFFEWIVSYDYIVYNEEKIDYALETAEMKSLFRSEFGADKTINDYTWKSFLWKLKFGFKEVEL